MPLLICIDIFIFQDSHVLGVVLGAVLGFVAGAIVVCVACLCYARRSKSFHLKSDGRPKIDYYSTSSDAFLVSQTRPVQVQPSVYTLAKPQSGGESHSEIKDVDDVDNQRFRVTKPYEFSSVSTIEEIGEEAEGGAIVKVGENGSPDKEKTKLAKRMSLPATLKTEGLVNPSAEDYFRKKSSEDECRLEFSCFYDTGSRELHVTVIQVVGISSPDESFLRPPNCSVKMRILPEMLEWQWTRKISRTTNPAFNETFIVPGFVHNKLRECTVHFVVLDFDHVQDNVYVIGEVFMPLSELRANRLEKITKRVNPLSF